MKCIWKPDSDNMVLWLFDCHFSLIAHLQKQTIWDTFWLNVRLWLPASGQDVTWWRSTKSKCQAITQQSGCTTENQWTYFFPFSSYLSILVFNRVLFLSKPVPDPTFSHKDLLMQHKHIYMFSHQIGNFYKKKKKKKKRLAKGLAKEASNEIGTKKDNLIKCLSNIPSTLPSRYLSKSASFFTASGETFGAPGKQINTTLILSRLPWKTNIKIVVSFYHDNDNSVNMVPAGVAMAYLV